jgi:hypothetical protein
MGNCTKPKHHKTDATKIKRLENQSSFILKFFIKLSKVKIRDLSLTSSKDPKVSVDFTFPHKTITLPGLLKSEEVYRWPSVHESIYEYSLDELNTHRLEVIVNANGKVFCSTSIKINSIIDGPVHQNLSLESNKIIVGRISFDLEFLEETRLQISALSLHFELEEDNLGTFSSSIKFASDFSKESLHSETSDHPSWDLEEGTVGVDFLVTMNKIRDAALQLRLYKHHKSKKELVGDCWINFTKIFAQDLSAIYRKESFLDFNSIITQQFDYDKVLRSIHAEHFKNLSEDLWLCGRKVGKVQGALKISGMPTFVQLISGVNTENGITVQNLNIVNTNKPKKNLPKEIIEIQKMMNKLKKSVKFQSGKVGAAHERELFKYKMNLIDNLCDLLKKSAKESIMLYTFNSSKALMKSQRILIELTNYLVEYAPMVNYDIKPFYFQAILLVINRGELDIGHLSLIKTANDILDEKQKIAAEYLKMLQGVLKVTFSRMVYKGVDSVTQVYIDKTLAICWFRIPQFRDIVKELVKKKSYFTIEEWRTSEDEDETHSIANPLDWDPFHELIPKDFKDDSFAAALQQPDWRGRLEKRGLAFFSFFHEWIDHVYKQTISHHFMWSCVTGYKILLKVFFIEMKERHTIEYPDILVSCASKLLYDPRNFNVMVRILFKKTNVYDFHSVQEMFKVLNQMFSSYFSYKQILPSNFDIDFFVKGLNVCLNDENALNIAKCLWFIYNQFHLLQGNLRKSIVLETLLKSKFKKFHFHWSKDVRNMFHHFLCYRVLSLKHFNFEKSEENKEVTQEILQKVQKLLESTKREDLRSLQSTYFEMAQEEFLKVNREYEDWVKKLPTPGNKLFIVSDTFPYPTINPKLNFLDLAERRMEEQW